MKEYLIVSFHSFLPMMDEGQLVKLEKKPENTILLNSFQPSGDLAGNVVTLHITHEWIHKWGIL